MVRILDIYPPRKIVLKLGLPLEVFFNIGSGIRESISDFNQMEIFGTKDKLKSIDLINKAIARIKDKYEDRQKDLFNEQIIQEPKAAFGELSSQTSIGRNERKGQKGQVDDAKQDVGESIQGDLFNEKPRQEDQLDLFPVPGSSSHGNKSQDGKTKKPGQSNKKTESNQSNKRLDANVRVDVETTGNILHNGLAVEIHA